MTSDKWVDGHSAGGRRDSPTPLPRAARMAGLAEDARSLAAMHRRLARAFEEAAARAPDLALAQRNVVAALVARRLAANEERVARRLDRSSVHGRAETAARGVWEVSDG